MAALPSVELPVGALGRRSGLASNGIDTSAHSFKEDLPDATLLPGDPKPG